MQHQFLKFPTVEFVHNHTRMSEALAKGTSHIDDSTFLMSLKPGPEITINLFLICSIDRRTAGDDEYFHLTMANGSHDIVVKDPDAFFLIFGIMPAK